MLHRLIIRILRFFLTPPPAKNIPRICFQTKPPPVRLPLRLSIIHTETTTPTTERFSIHSFILLQRPTRWEKTIHIIPPCFHPWRVPTWCKPRRGIDVRSNDPQHHHYHHPRLSQQHRYRRTLRHSFRVRVRLRSRPYNKNLRKKRQLLETLVAAATIAFQRVRAVPPRRCVPRPLPPTFWRKKQQLAQQEHLVRRYPLLAQRQHLA